MKKLTLILAASALIAAQTVDADDLSSTANVNLLSALSLAETTQVDFGTLVINDGTCTMATGGALSGAGGQTCSGTQQPGLFTITGTDGQTLDISASAGAAVDGVTFNPVIDGPATVTLSGGSATVDMIGNLVLSGATEGAKAISYTFTANYQ